MNEALNVKDMKLYAEADSIFADLAARGFPAGSALDVNVVSQIDQLHYHGAASVHQAIDALAITAQASVLEVGAGWGGPSRYIAATAGARVTALELQEDFSTVGEELTRRCGLAALVTHRRDDFLTVDFGDERFDHVGSWLALYHIPDRARYTAKIAELLKPGGDRIHRRSDPRHRLCRRRSRHARSGIVRKLDGQLRDVHRRPQPCWLRHPFRARHDGRLARFHGCALGCFHR